MTDKLKLKISDWDDRVLVRENIKDINEVDGIVKKLKRKFG